MNNQKLKVVGFILLFVISLAAIGFGGTGFFYMLHQSILDFSTTTNMDQSIGWELFFWLLIGIPSAVLFIAGICGVTLLRLAWRRYQQKLQQSVPPPLPPTN